MYITLQTNNLFSVGKAVILGLLKVEQFSTPPCDAAPEAQTRRLADGLKHYFRICVQGWRIRLQSYTV